MNGWTVKPAYKNHLYTPLFEEPATVGIRLYERRHSIMHWHESLNRITPNNLSTPENTSRGSALSWKPMRRGILKFPVLLRYFKCTLCLIETGEVTRADFSSGEQRSPIFQIALIPFEPGNFKRFREVSVEPVHHGSSLMVMLSAMAWVTEQGNGRLRIWTKRFKSSRHALFVFCHIELFISHSSWINTQEFFRLILNVVECSEIFSTPEIQFPPNDEVSRFFYDLQTSIFDFSIARHRQCATLGGSLAFD